MVIGYKDLHRYDDINDILAKKNIISLFRFIPFNDNEGLNKLKLNTLKNNKEHVSSPLEFNDPYDCELSFNLMDGIDNYLDLCKQVGKEPEKEFKGSFNVRIPSELHKKISILAAQQKITLNQYVVNALSKSI